MTTLQFQRDGWLPSAENSDSEGSSLTRLRIRAGETLVTRNYSKRGGGESEAVNVSMLPLANFLANTWWPLLYEPLRPYFTRSFQARHRLDTGMRGYSFPAMALCSAGENAIALDWVSLENPHSTISFVAPSPAEPIQLDRNATEIALMDLVQATLERVPTTSPERQALYDNWNRVVESLNDPDERSYCVIAGRLGLDPYDPDGPNLEQFASGLRDELFADVSEAAEVSELESTTAWLRDAVARMAMFSEVDVSQFGPPPVDDLLHPAWATGEASALAVRVNTGHRNEHPRMTVDNLLGDVVHRARELGRRGPETVTAVFKRSDDNARIVTVSKTARQRRFRACSAAYLAWTAQPGEERAATVALTRRQQASRAFAAEMVAPQDVLIERAGNSGFDSDDLEALASEFVCPFATVMWQAHRAGIRLRGVDLPTGPMLRVIRNA
jgi:hypothetical protein